MKLKGSSRLEEDRIRIGISGWTYPPWRGTFYPAKLPHHRELAYASRQVNSIEINGSFYSLQRPSSYLKWYEATPPDFVFSVKANRYITHILRLNEIEKPLANFFASGVLLLREKLGGILWQFPPNMKFDPPRMERFLELLPQNTGQALKLAEGHDLWSPWTPDDEEHFSMVVGAFGMRGRRIHHAVEVRNASFDDPVFFRLLRKYRAALVVSDSGGKWPYFEEITSDFIYLRLHGAEALYASGYDEKALDLWEGRIRNWIRYAPRAFVYFDNDAKVFAPFNAISLLSRLTAFVPERAVEISRVA